PLGLWGRQSGPKAKDSGWISCMEASGLSQSPQDDDPLSNPISTDATDPNPDTGKTSIEGISHITFIVRNPDRMAEILTQVLDAQEVYSRQHLLSGCEEKFFLIGNLWVAVLQGDPLPTKTYNHVAFKIPAAALPEYRQRVEQLGLEILPSRPRQAGEGQSLYFYDEDQHLFELHSGTLAERLAALREKPE
ncbi:MAG: FosX/FosE/FosI family fosfomycin resistance hydrolase, partial [Thermostichus sp. BF3_bins_97]